MSVPFKPENYNSVAPYFIVNGAQKLIDLLTEVFGTKPLRRYDNENGSIMHAEILLDDSVIMISDATEQFQSNQLLMHVYVKNVNETYRKAIAAGCTEIQKPIKKDDPDMRGMFADFAGNTWAVATQTEV